MKKILLLMVAIVCATMSYAQTMVATLTHGNDIKMFYGNFALQNAMDAAENGDVINLSAGAFQATNITKAVSIRGVGFLEENTTYIINNFDIDIPTNVTDRLTIEGVKISGRITSKRVLTNALFMRDYIQEFDVALNTGTIAKNVMFVNCRVMGGDLRGNTSLQFVNSYVENIINSARSTASGTFVNCVVNQGLLYELSSCDFVNCIISGWSGYSLPDTSSATNCVGLSDWVFREVVAGVNNKTASDAIFVDNDIWNDLTENAKAIYIGTDGTPVGMYGGIVPFSAATSYPRITKMNVANKTTADGKLSVDIEVSAGQ